MGGKRIHAPDILEALGVRRGGPIEAIHWIDSTEWGWVWPVILHEPSLFRCTMRLTEWERELWGPGGTGDVGALWDRLIKELPTASTTRRRLESWHSGDPGADAAQWLWAQSRTASGVPAWYSDGNNDWRMGDHPDRQRAGMNTGEQLPGKKGGTWRMGEQPSKAKRGDRTPGQTGGEWLVSSAGGPRTPDPSEQLESYWRPRGLLHPKTIADRLIALHAALRDLPIHVHHCDVAEFDAPPGSVVYFDPPYQSGTRYRDHVEREVVLEVAERDRAAGCRVAVSEAGPLPLEGWHHLQLQAGTQNGHRAHREEWLTLSHPPPAPRQVGMFAGMELGIR